uniref:Uncharacterized LOC103174414 n=1 Tax=Callorhinchus milii TaxID=7868 RepID=A0A4W3GZK3_CALMI
MMCRLFTCFRVFDLCLTQKKTRMFKSGLSFCFVVPPKITAIESKPKEIKHGEKTELQWAVTGFTPGKMSIISSVQRKGEQIRQLFHWEAQDKKTFEGKTSAFSLKDLSDGRNKDASFTAQVPKCEQDKHKDGTFRVMCSITVTPDASTDNEAELTVQVKHEALNDRDTCIERIKLQVPGVAPTVTEIDLRPEIKHSEVARLSWSVTGFTPKPISIVFLLKRKGELKEKRLFHWRIPEKGGIDDEAKMGSTALTDVRDRCEEDD